MYDAQIITVVRGKRAYSAAYIVPNDGSPPQRLKFHNLDMTVTTNLLAEEEHRLMARFTAILIEGLNKETKTL